MHRKIRFFIHVFVVLELFGPIDLVGRPTHDQDSIYNILIAKLSERLGNSYGSVDFYEFDTVLVTREMSPDVADPYGTLKGCVFFVAYNDSTSDSSYIGMMKDGSIRWLTSFPIKGQLTEIESARDFTRAGHVQIAVRWAPVPESNTVYDLWVIDWDGELGQILNPVVYEEWDNALHARSQMRGLVFDFVDISSAEPTEIVASARTKFTVYRWSGSSYTKIGSLETLPPRDSLPFDLFESRLRCSISYVDSRFRYEYELQSAASSLQSVDLLEIHQLALEANVFCPDGWMKQLDTIHRKIALLPIPPIRPGRSVSGFGSFSTCLPSIVPYVAIGDGGGCGSSRRFRWGFPKYFF